MFILDRVGKRRILLSTYPGMVLGLALASVAFWKMTSSTGHRLIEGEAYPTNWSNMMLGMMVVFIAFYATGSGNITWTVSELFPLEMRGLGASILAGGIWAANIVISSTFLTLMNAIGPTPTFALYAAICAVSIQSRAISTRASQTRTDTHLSSASSLSSIATPNHRDSRSRRFKLSTNTDSASPSPGRSEPSISERERLNEIQRDSSFHHARLHPSTRSTTFDGEKVSSWRSKFVGFVGLQALLQDWNDGIEQSVLYILRYQCHNMWITRAQRLAPS